MTEIKLKPCPFCGGKAEFVRFTSGFVKVRCKKCDALAGEGSTRWDASGAWNTRVPEKDEEGDDNNVKTDNHC